MVRWHDYRILLLLITPPSFVVDLFGGPAWRLCHEEVSSLQPTMKQQIEIRFLGRSSHLSLVHTLRIFIAIQVQHSYTCQLMVEFYSR